MSGELSSFPAASLEDWRRRVECELGGRPFDSIRWRPHHGLVVEPLYTGANALSFPARHDEPCRHAEPHILYSTHESVVDELVGLLSFVLGASREGSENQVVVSVGLSLPLEVAKLRALRILWAGLAPNEPLVTLQKRVVAACRRAGCPPDGKTFRPHITLARLSRGAGPIGGWLAQHALLPSDPWTVESFALYQSHLRPEGSQYEPVAVFPLMP